MFSATIPFWIKDIAKRHMRPDHLVINLAKDVQNKTNVNINHIAMECYDFT